MLGSRYDIEMQQGSTYELLLTVRDASQNLVNFTDCSAQMQIRSSYSTSTIAANANITLGGATGNISISVPADVTANIKVDLAGKGKPPHSTYVYDLELTDANNKISKILYGDVTVYGEVTR